MIWSQLVLDVLMVAFVVFGLLIGIRRGFIKLVFHHLRRVASLVCAFFLAKPLGERFQYLIAEPLKGLLRDYIGESVGINTSEELVGQVPTVIKGLAGLFGAELNAMADEALSSGQNAIDTFLDAATDPIARALAIVAAFIALYFVGLIVIRILGFIIDKLFQLPGLKQVNKILGAVFGLAFYAVFAWIACKLLVFGIGLAGGSDIAFLADFDITKTYIARYVYQFDPLKWILSF
ncbi:MAG: CvpA family protein [Eubacteriales bacterium]